MSGVIIVMLLQCKRRGFCSFIFSRFTCLHFMTLSNVDVWMLGLVMLVAPRQNFRYGGANYINIGYARKIFVPEVTPTN